MRLRIDRITVEHDDLMNWANINIENPTSWIAEVAQTIREWFSDEDYISIRTSGSTGKPKKIVLHKSAMRKSAQLTIRYFNLRREQKALLCLPAQFIAGKMMIIRALVANLDLYCVEPSSTALLKDSIDFVAMTPYQVSKSLDADKSVFEKVGILIIGGAQVSPSLFQRLQNISAQCYQTYGMTETITHVAVQKLNGEDTQEYFEVLDGIEIEEENGCLIIRATHLDVPIRTTDLVKIKNDRQFAWLGRADHVINSGGIKLQPELIERKMSTVIPHPLVLLAEKDEGLGEIGVLFIADTSSVIDESELKDKLRPIINRYEMPKKIYFVEALVETETGKVRRDRSLYPE